MTRNELIITIAVVLSVTFILGWLVRALLGRFQRIVPQSVLEIKDLTERLQAAEVARDQARTAQQGSESDLTTRLSRTADELRLALDSLRESRIEIEELRAYIDRKLRSGSDEST